MPEPFTSRPRAMLRRGPTGAILSASICVHRRPGESAAAFQCRIQRDFGAILANESDPPQDGPIRMGSDALVSRVEWQIAPSGFVLSARMVPLNGSAPFTVPRDPGESLGHYMKRLRADHRASIPPLDFMRLNDAEQLSGEAM